MTVLLLGNYIHDYQESMQRFVRMLSDGLPARQVVVESIQPTPLMGALKPSATGIGKWLGYIDKFLLFPFVLRWRVAKLRRKGPLVVHICDHSNAFYTRYLQDVPHVVTCHDLLAVRSARGEIAENPTRWTGRQLQAMITGGLKMARHIACVSAATEADVLRLIPLPKERVSMIPVGLNYPFSPMPEPEAIPRISALFASEKSVSIIHHPSIPNPTPRFLLHVGGNQWYKNRLGVLHIYAQAVALDSGLPDLVMVGKPFTSEMEDFVSAQQLGGRVRKIEGASDEDLRALYSGAEILLFPSLAEGFGWPVIEAQACGCPVVASNLPPMNLIGGSSACYFDPRDLAAGAAALTALCTELPDARKGRIAAGMANAEVYSAEAMIDRYVDLYRQIVEAASAATTA